MKVTNLMMTEQKSYGLIVQILCIIVKITIIAATVRGRRIDMAGWQLLLLGYFLGAPLGFLLCSVLVASKDPPKPHTTCKDCVHRHKKECPFSHIECDVTGDSIFWHTNKQDDFYCKEAQDIGLPAQSRAAQRCAL